MPWIMITKEKYNFLRERNLDMQLESTLLILLHGAFGMAHEQILVLLGTQVGA